MRFRTLLRTALQLGIGNISRVAIYRLCKRAGVYRLVLPQDRVTALDFATQQCGKKPWSKQLTLSDKMILREADELLQGTAKYFSMHPYSVGSPPDWFLNPFLDKRHPHPSSHWSKIADFSCEIGDVKTIWEMSRFSWAPVLAHAFRLSGNQRYLSALQEWVNDWWCKNPPNCGPNWMCAQETAIRLINTLLAWQVAKLEVGASRNDLALFVESHCRRIYVTVPYAIAQENNHATSEGAGLFVGGTWLSKSGSRRQRRRGERWATKGRRLVERAVRHLVTPDGSFSQHSLTYHRLFLDTLSIVELWRRDLKEPRFSPLFYERAAAATNWMAAMIDPTTGDGPNLGPNDGANPYCFNGTGFRDFRMSLETASSLFLSDTNESSGAPEEGQSLSSIGVRHIESGVVRSTNSVVFPEGGYVVMCNPAGARVIIRAPNGCFRPTHADALHVDLWWNGRNLIRDGGSYTYADLGGVAGELASVIGHSTIQFDDQDQMPRLGRFLYGDWIHVSGSPTISTSVDGESWTGSYESPRGVRHKREVILKHDTLCVVDELQGFTRNATLRWRLAQREWAQTADGCVSAAARVSVESTVPVRRLTVNKGWESRFYLQRSQIPVLEVDIDHSPATLTTIFKLY